MSTMGREYDCKAQRRRRAKKLAALRQREVFCPQRAGRYGRCNARLETVVLPTGATKLHCPRCARREAGICRDCPAPVQGQPRKAWYCAGCRERRAKQAQELYRDRHREELRPKWAAHARKYRAIDPSTSRRCAKAWQQKNRERRNAYVRAYRQRNREKWLKQQKRWRRNAKRRQLQMAA